MPFQFKIQLTNIDNPPVWRRVIVPENITFDDFHYCHMYQFSKSGWSSKPAYKIPDDEDDFFDDGSTEDSSEVEICGVFTKPKQKFTYIYDFGDDWKHQITLEKITEEKVIAPICTAGEGACPPEDCGGAYGYYNLLEILNNPKNPEHKEMKEWLGLSKNERWDANAFDIDAARARLNQRD